MAWMFNVTGAITGSATAFQLPDVESQVVMFKGRAGNIGSFFIGGSQSTTEYEIDAGQQTEWIPLENLNKLWTRNPSGTSDTLLYWLQR